MNTPQSRKSFGKASIFLVFLGISISEEDDGSLSRPPMRLFGRLQGRHSAMHEDESVDSRSAESGDSDNVLGSDRGFSVQWSGSESDEEDAGW